MAKIARVRCERILRQRDAPFLPYELLYLRRDMAHMGKANLARLLEQLDAKQTVRLQLGLDRREAWRLTLARGVFLPHAGHCDQRGAARPVHPAQGRGTQVYRTRGGGPGLAQPNRSARVRHR